MAGRYDLVRELGRGAQGRVWLAHDSEQQGAACAIKAVPDAWVERLRWEWDVLHRVRHPALVRAIDLLTLDVALPELELRAGTSLLVTTLAPGQSLDRAIAPTVGTPERVTIAAQVAIHVAPALHALHQAGLTHGDVKAQNIVWHTPRAMLIDLGLAAPPSSAGSISGTPTHLAPEAWRGERSAATDMFALGITLLQCVQGRLDSDVTRDPPDAPHVLTALAQHAWRAQDDARALPDAVPPALRNLLVALLSPEPHARPTAAELTTRLRNSFDILAPGSLPPDEDSATTDGTHPAQLRLDHWARVGDESALRTLGTRLQDAGVTFVIGPRGSGRTRLIRDAVTRLQRERVQAADTPPAYVSASRLPSQLPARDCVLHLHDADAPVLADLHAWIASSAVNGHRLRVVVEQERAPAEAEAIRIPPLDRDAVHALLQQASPDSPVSAAAVARVMSLSGGLPGRIVGLLREHPRTHGDLDGHLRALDVSDAEADVAPIPRELAPVVALLAAAGGTLDAHTARTALGKDAALVGTAAGHLLQHGLASLDDNGQPRLRADVTRRVRQTVATKNELRLLRRALDVTQDPRARAYLLQRVDDSDALRHAAAVVVSMRERGDASGAATLGLDVLRDAPHGALHDALAIETCRALVLLGRYAEVAPWLRASTDPAAHVVWAEAERRRGALPDAARILAQTSEHDARPDVLACAARLAFDQGDHDRASELAQRALHATGWPRVRALEVLAWLDVASGDLTQARARAEHGLIHARQHSLHADSARLLSVLANIDRAQGQITTARDHQRQALERAEAAGDVHGASLCLLNLGLTEVDAGELGPGLLALREAARRLLRLGRTSDAARALYNVGNAAALIGDDDGAMSTLALAERAATTAQVHNALAYTRLCQAEISMRRHDETTTRARLAQLSTHTGLSRDERAIVDARTSLLWQRIGDSAAADRTLTPWLTTNEPISAAAGAELALAQCQHAIERRDQSTAWAASQRALQQSEQANTFELRLRSALSSAQVLEAMGRPTEAVSYLQLARRLLERVTEGLSPSERAQLRRVPSYRAAFVATPSATGAAAASHDARWRKLAHLTTSLLSEPTPARLLTRVLDAAIDLVNAERGFVVERQGDALQLRARRGLTEQPLDDTAAPSRTFVTRVIEDGRAMASVDALQDARLDAAASVHALSLRSVIAVPLRTDDGVAGAIYLDDRLRPFAFGDEEVALLSALADVAALSLAGLRRSAAERDATRRLKRLRKRLKRTVDAQALELSSLRQSSDVGLDHPSIVGRGTAMRALLAMVDRVARSELPVLITGESGSGKELIARAIAEHGPRKGAVFVSENCAAIPEPLLESALFGHVRGAFTGADRPRVGLFEAADGGTLFLDEIGEMSAAMQTRLLRVLQDGELRPVGSERARKVDVRVIAATHRDLEQMVRDGSFRQDLYYRLAVVSLRVPALRERAEDIPELIAHFARKHAVDGHAPRFDRKALTLLSAHRWPGNVRQLENEVRRALVLADGVVRIEHLSPALSGETSERIDDLSLRGHTDALERRLIRAAMEQTRHNQTQAAKLLGVSRYGLQKMLKRLGIA